ncbi:MAG: hypothetical protein QM723_18365 [Myxococcaceae bacterium]
MSAVEAAQLRAEIVDIIAGAVARLLVDGQLPPPPDDKQAPGGGR